MLASIEKLELVFAGFEKVEVLFFLLLLIMFFFLFFSFEDKFEVEIRQLKCKFSLFHILW